MIFAAMGTTGYSIMLLLHLLAAIVGFAPAWLWPVLGRMAATSDANAANGLEVSILRYSLPGVGLAGFLGFGLAGMSEKVFRMSQPWLMAAVTLWLLTLAVYFFVARPAIAALRDGDASAKRVLGAAAGASHLALVVILFLMIFKPGL